MLIVPISKARPEASATRLAVPAELSAEASSLQSVVRALIAHLLRERRDHPDVEDAAAEVFRRALEGQQRLRSGEPVRPWVLGIARHVAIDALRSRGRSAARRAPEARDDDGRPRDAIDGVPDSAPGPESITALSEQSRHIREAMTRINRSQRQALLLFHVEGLGYGEIAAELGVPVGTVGTWIARGRQNLATALEKETKKP